MKDKQKIGKIGEYSAVEHLLNWGYLILERNWRFHRAEIDIIAKRNELLIFVEVKTRQSDRFGKPEDFVSSAQRKMIIGAAARYMEKMKHEWAVQFDVIGILVNKHGIVQRLNHYEDAFF